MRRFWRTKQLVIFHKLIVIKIKKTNQYIDSTRHILTIDLFQDNQYQVGRRLRRTDDPVCFPRCRQRTCLHGYIYDRVFIQLLWFNGMMDAKVTTCEDCGGEAVEGQQVPLDLEIQHSGPLCKECHQNKIKKTEKEKHDEYKRKKLQQYMDEQAGLGSSLPGWIPPRFSGFNR